MTLKQQIEDDAKNIFMNTDEMAVTAIVAGESFPVVRDVSNELDITQAMGSAFSSNSGMVAYVNRVYFADADYPQTANKPTPGMIIIIDNERLQVKTAQLESGMWRVDFATTGNTFGV